MTSVHTRHRRMSQTHGCQHHHRARKTLAFLFQDCDTEVSQFLCKRKYNHSHFGIQWREFPQPGRRPSLSSRLMIHRNGFQVVPPDCLQHSDGESSSVRNERLEVIRQEHSLPHKLITNHSQLAVEVPCWL